MGELGVLFNPGMRHEREEKLAKQMLREDEGTGRKGRLGIDLESGVVVINSGTARPAGPAASTDAPQAGKLEAKTEPPANAPSAGHASSVDRPVEKKRNPAEPPRTGSRAAQHSPAAVPSGKARRGAEAADRGTQTGKSRRRGR